MQFDGEQRDRVANYRWSCAFGFRCGRDVIPVEFGVTYLVQGGAGLCGR